jgi:hypothetical protein
LSSSIHASLHPHYIFTLTDNKTTTASSNTDEIETANAYQLLPLIVNSSKHNFKRRPRQKHQKAQNRLLLPQRRALDFQTHNSYRAKTLCHSRRDAPGKPIPYDFVPYFFLLAFLAGFSAFLL